MQQSSANPPGPSKLWWRDAVVYEVYVRSFADSDGDGEGDLAGIQGRLPHLRDLGVDALWLTPFYTSPLADGGYDVANYREVDPRFGSLADFDALVAEAHRLGLRIIVDIVPNHTSDRHAWFQEALASPPGSPARDRYIFRSTEGDDPPNDWPSAFGGSAWTRVADGEWYLHLYAPEQPDLNWHNAEVRAEFEDILRFWLDRGADGFRIDVAAGLFKDPSFADLGELGRHAPGSPMYGRPEVHGVYRDWRRILDSYSQEDSTLRSSSGHSQEDSTLRSSSGHSAPGRERMAVGEVWNDSPAEVARFLRPDELHQAFTFALQLAPWSAEQFRTVVSDCLRVTAPIHAAPTWVLSSHDAVRHRTRYEDGSGHGLERVRAALLFMLALPGSAYLYQGEELGLPEVFDLPDEARQDPVWFRTGGTQLGRDGCRVPIPWSGDAPPYGFSTGTPWLPQPLTWGPLTVAAEAADPESTLSFYRRALALRRELVAGLPEHLEWLDAPGKNSLLFRRGDFRCLLNCGDDPVPLPSGTTVLLGEAPEGMLPGNSAVWLRA